MSRTVTFLSFLISFGADRWSKILALENLEPGKTEPLIPFFIQLTLTSNTGGAFGLGKENAGTMTGLAVLISFGLLFWIIRKEFGITPPSNLERTGLGLILGGAFGNLCDRFTLGRVTDFLEFTFVSFPIFNVADISIDLGAALIVIAALYPMKAAQNQDKSQTTFATYPLNSSETSKSDSSKSVDEAKDA